jgi:phenylpyruvate tautomerase PptA (4-oxalocrotonate tautomerase family)
MPYIEVKATENRFADPAVRERLIAELTDAACRVFGEDLRPNIWVVVEAVPGQQWGVGGKPLSLQVVCPAVRQPDHRNASRLRAAPGAVVRVSRKAPGDVIPMGTRW